MSTSIPVYKGPTWLDLLGLLFIGLKLSSIINWSWWWVTMPLWINIALALVLFIVGHVIVLVAKMCGVDTKLTKDAIKEWEL